MLWLWSIISKDRWYNSPLYWSIAWMLVDFESSLYGGIIMKSNNDKKFTGYILAVALGAIGGGFLVTVVTKAIPKMMAGMMENMMSEMAAGDCEPADI